MPLMTDLTLGATVDYQHRAGEMAGEKKQAKDVRWGVHAAYAL